MGFLGCRYVWDNSAIVYSFCNNVPRFWHLNRTFSLICSLICDVLKNVPDVSGEFCWKETLGGFCFCFDETSCYCVSFKDTIHCLMFHSVLRFSKNRKRRLAEYRKRSSICSFHARKDMFNQLNYKKKIFRDSMNHQLVLSLC